MNPIFLKIGNIEIYWYSIFILIGILVAYVLITREAKKRNISSVFINNLFFYVIIFGLIGARLYYVIFEYKQYINNPLDILKVWEGGLAIHGGIIAGIIVTIVMCKKNKINPLKIMDIAVVGVIIAQSLGRWGNFFNSEAFGPETTYEFLSSLYIPNFIIDGMNINGVYYHPTFLYESIWNLLGFIFLIIIRKNKKIKIGQLTGMYFIWYSFARFFIESLRQDSLILFGVFKQAQVISIILIIVGITILIKSKNNNKYCEE